MAEAPLVELREAKAQDWTLLGTFFRRIYREGHPLRREKFWTWQFGEPAHGRSFIVLDERRIRGHLGATFGGGIAWVNNLWLDPECRGQGFLRRLHSMARQYGPVAATNINAAGLNMYRSMGFIRYCDLQRYVLLRSDVESKDAVQPIVMATDLPNPTSEHYWTQPSLKGARLPDGSTVVLQPQVGGARAIDIVDPGALATTCFDLGARWIDFVTSWNDPWCPRLERCGWSLGDPIPYRLEPLVPGSRSAISFVSEQPLPNAFVVKRSYSDHGRVPSLP